jgi:phosphatidyl-myo-inositol dimannoside synthase
MTTLLLALDFPPMGGGIARLHGEMAKRYPARELLVSTPQDPDAPDFDAELQGGGGMVDRLPVSRQRTRSLTGLLMWSRRAASLARKNGVRYVHCGNVKPAGYPARWVFERCRVPYGVYLHGGDLLSEQHKIRHSQFKRRSARAILGGAAVLMANSSWTRDLARQVLGELGIDGDGERLRVVHLGTDPDHFKPGLDPAELRARFELPDDGTRWLLTVARLDPHKGVDTVIAALPAVVERFPTVHYAVAGDGADRERLEKLAHRSGVADRVRFLGGVSDRDLPALYNLASVYVGVSRISERIGVEGFGISLVEASACGLPVVAGNSGGIPDAVRDGETGFLVSPEDPAALVAAIIRLLADPDAARRVGAAGRRAVETYYNWDRVVRDLRAIEAEVIRNGGASPREPLRAGR